MCMIEYKNLKPQPDLKDVRFVSLLKDTRPKTHMDFGYTMNALRSKKKVGECFEVEYDLISCV